MTATRTDTELHVWTTGVEALEMDTTELRNLVWALADGEEVAIPAIYRNDADDMRLAVKSGSFWLNEMLNDDDLDGLTLVVTVGYGAGAGVVAFDIYDINGIRVAFNTDL